MEIFGQKWRLRRYEAGISIGTTQIFGDIGGYPNAENGLGLRDINILATRPSGGINLRYKIDPLYSVSFNSVMGYGVGSDAGTINDRGRSYRTMITEFSFRLEYFLKPEDKQIGSGAVFNKRGMINNFKTYSAYGFIGLGGIYLNPKLNRGDRWREDIDLASGYSKINMVIPIGLGVRYVFDDQWVTGVELGWRWTASDYIDGYTQIQGSKHNDVYYFLLFTANYRLKTSRKNLPIIFDRSFKTTRRRRRVI